MKLGQGNIFTGICLSTGGSASVHAGIYPQDQTGPPWTRPPWHQTPPDQTPQTRPPREADSSIWSMSGRYASYWNAFLFQKCVSRILSTGGCLLWGVSAPGGVSAPREGCLVWGGLLPGGSSSRGCLVQGGLLLGGAWSGGHSGGGAWSGGGVPGGDPPQTATAAAVRILLECILFFCLLCVMLSVIFM